MTRRQQSKPVHQAIVLASIMSFYSLTACSFLWDEDPTDPIEELAEEPYSPPVKVNKESDQWIDEEELDSGPASSATEAPNEVMDKHIRLSTTDYLEGPSSFWVAIDLLSVRSGPSHKFRKTGVLKRGAKVTVLERRGNWIRIEADQWVSKNYLKTRP